MAYLYRHIRLDKNEPFYIGIGSNKARCYTKKTRNKHWNSKYVLDTDTGVYYGSVREASVYAGMNVTTFIRKMKKGNYKYIIV